VRINFENKSQTSIKSTIKYIKYVGMSGAAEPSLTKRPVSSVLAEITRTDRPTIIILGEDHFYKPETFTVISKIIEDTIKKFGAENIAIYTEAPEEQLSILESSPDFTDHHILRIQTKYYLGRVASAVTVAEREVLGSSDDRYAADILDIFRRFVSNPKHCIIACVGLLHSVEIFNRIPEAFDKHVYNVCGLDTVEKMVEIYFGVVDGHVTNETYLSLRRLPIIVDDGASQSGGSNRKSKKRKMIKKKSKKNNKRK
jgi:hypothetical protein